MTFQRAYKIASHNSTVCGYPGRLFDWSLFDWHQETEHDFGFMSRCYITVMANRQYARKAPAVYADGRDCRYLHVPYNWAKHATIYRVRPNPTMETGQVYRGHLILKQEAEERDDGWHWVLTMEKRE